eukprot:TRINITY_DN45904_c0_g1_i1.p1 TRINITY_DN45904_c0_g1~~TRINITY_DN45904_c0_g1_i1.p1  ORF type:complete len:210 (-),score=30.71 TRINITY_DN45904_c0_g1_i1:541-1170(-)
MDSGEFTLLFKVVVIGDSGVGKSNLMTRYALDDFNIDSASTIGVEYMCRSVPVDGKEVKVQIWDTAGQERFRAISRSIYHGAKGALIVYDITNQASFDAVPQWLSELKRYVAPNTAIILVGNKVDLEHSRVVRREVAEQFARENGLAFLEASALNTTNVDKAFDLIVREIYNQNPGGGAALPPGPTPRQPQGVKLDQHADKPRKQGCCK